MGYDAELDISPELEEASNFETIIDILRWMIEFGRINIRSKVFIVIGCSISQRGASRCGSACYGLCRS